MGASFLGPAWPCSGVLSVLSGSGGICHSLPHILFSLLLSVHGNRDIMVAARNPMKNSG